MPDTRPDMEQRALFVASNAACRLNKMLLAELKVDIHERQLLLPLSTGHDERPDAIHQVLFVSSTTMIGLYAQLT